MNKTCIFNFSRHFMDSVLPIRRDGRVWFKAAVLKTAVAQATVGSNLTPLRHLFITYLLLRIYSYFSVFVYPFVPKGFVLAQFIQFHP